MKKFIKTYNRTITMNRSVNLLVVMLCMFPFLETTSLSVDRGIKTVHVLDKQDHRVGSYGQSHALVIGISRYKAGWPNLYSVIPEIDKIEKALKNIGFSVTVKKDLDSRELRDAFQDFIAKKGYEKDSRLLFFFAGHGHSRENGTKGYIVPADSPLPNASESAFLAKAIPMSQIIEWSRQIESKHAIFLFDSCFSGTLFKSRSNQSPPPHISAKLLRPVRQFITAGDAYQQVPAKSSFVSAFVMALDGNADLTGDGYITGTELGIYIQDTVPYYSPGQTPLYGKIQDPDLSLGDFVFKIDKRSTMPGSQITHPITTPVPQGEIIVNTFPENSTISIDGDRVQGNHFSILANVSHIVQVNCDGYESRKYSVSVESGKSKAINISLSSSHAYQSFDIPKQVIQNKKKKNVPLRF